MPVFTYLSDHEVAAGRSVPDDEECNELLQELRAATGEDWIIIVTPIRKERNVWKRLFGMKLETFQSYRLFADCHGEWQVINVITPEGGSVFYIWEHSREAVMNYMLGYLGGLQYARIREAARPPAPEPSRPFVKG